LVFGANVATMAAVLGAPGELPAQEPGLSPTFALDVAVESGWPTSGIQTVKLVRFGLAFPFRLTSGDGWRLEAPVALYPLSWVRNVVGGRWEERPGPRYSTIGVTVHPLAIRVGRRTPVGTAYLGLAGGGAYFGRRMPTGEATRLNYSADLEAGLRFVTGSGYRVSLGYLFNHLSNGRDGNANLALDSHMVRVSVGGGQRR
jgi:hypothetical protein